MGGRWEVTLRPLVVLCEFLPMRACFSPAINLNWVGNVKLFNSDLRGLPCFADGIYWTTGLSLTTPFTEGCAGVNGKASPPGRHQEQAPKQPPRRDLVLHPWPGLVRRQELGGAAGAKA